MNLSQRNPPYSTLPTPHAIAAQYVWSDTAVNTGNGAGQPVTGNWVPAASSSPMGTPTASDAYTVQGVGYNSAVTLVRPGNTGTYPANAVVGVFSGATSSGIAPIEFANIGPTGGNIIITNGDLRIDVSSVPAGMTSFTLNLYTGQPSGILDGQTWNLNAADRSKFVGYFSYGNPVTFGSSLYVQATQINQQYTLAAGSISLWGELVTVGGGTYASGTVYTPRLWSLSA